MSIYIVYIILFMYSCLFIPLYIYYVCICMDVTC